MSECEVCGADSYGAPTCSTCEARKEADALRVRAEKAEAELAEVQGIARESMARFDELHSMLKEAKAERDEARAEVVMSKSTAAVVRAVVKYVNSWSRATRS